ncbi:coiled-coil domain-containing protein 15 [Python bivittatus]|uniref:Coiled-coil domain-containing protein 15 n=1 Tax=Python bivittatus TaxID=176946 RepID=A0A9F5MUM6_PYTBI|nr:coiled-coil domain-containing protein 15 [Python bivittatus]XP_025024861.1 coiled-coil domain-containing protein 15 [Python bivittatus]XP_025024862.1 coiled-coil domain-containing protein 15 [Python bivittatus]
MVPPKKGLQQHGSQKISESKVRPQSEAVNWNVLAGRTQCIVPVGAWVESAQDDGEEESPAFATAIQIEKEYKQQQKEKEKTLKRFQEEVKHRVNQRINLKRKQQLKASYEAALKESSVIIGFSDSALRLTPKKNTCLYRYNTDSAIGSSDDKVICVQQASYIPEQFSEQAKTVRKTVQQVRHKLASRKAVSEGNEPPELPGGIWQSPPRRQNSEPCNTTALSTEEGDIGELPLKGYHDLPAEVQEQEGRNWDNTVEFQKVNSEILKGSSPADTEAQAVQILWPGLEKEQSKKQHQSQYLRYRRLFMDIEREQVKEQQRQKEWQRKMDKIKKEKEYQRRAEEQRIQEAQRAKEERTQEMASQQNANPREKTCEKLQQLKLEDPEEKKKLVERIQKNKEYSRYVEALRAQMREKINMYNIHLPPLCFCGSDFWDTHPDSCANNCMFYKNHKAYARALQTVISSCDILDRGSNTRLSVHTFAAVHARSKNS